MFKYGNSKRFGVEDSHAYNFRGKKFLVYQNLPHINYLVRVFKIFHVFNQCLQATNITAQLTFLPAYWYPRHGDQSGGSKTPTFL